MIERIYYGDTVIDVVLAGGDTELDNKFKAKYDLAKADILDWDPVFMSYLEQELKDITALGSLVPVYKLREQMHILDMCSLYRGLLVNFTLVNQ